VVLVAVKATTVYLLSLENWLSWKRPQEGRLMRERQVTLKVPFLCAGQVKFMEIGDACSGQETLTL
jgi:hypothetical protein